MIEYVHQIKTEAIAGCRRGSLVENYGPYMAHGVQQQEVREVLLLGKQAPGDIGGR